MVRTKKKVAAHEVQSNVSCSYRDFKDHVKRNPIEVMKHTHLLTDKLIFQSDILSKSFLLFSKIFQYRNVL